ncbi:MAG: Double zinc ribbon [Candidatus Binatota bacterium]|jgi:predicted amidophosphoribosyltransferase|nr:Double zinc ribbon [Candidatus Binatota bacterium]
MTCSQCGEQIGEDAAGCEKCGGEVYADSKKEDVQPCPYCGRSISRRAPTCPECGASLEPRHPTHQRPFFSAQPDLSPGRRTEPLGKRRDLGKILSDFKSRVAARGRRG